MQNLSIRKLIYIIESCCLAVIYLLYYTNSTGQTIDCLKTLGVFALIQLVFIVRSWKRLTGAVVNAYTVFILACYVFNLGQPILEVFNAVAPNLSIIEHYNWDLDTYCKATVISMAFIIAFHCGAIMSIKKGYIWEGLSAEQFVTECKAIKRVALVIALLAFPCYMYNTIVRMAVAATYGYGALYEGDIGTIRIFTLIGDYYTPAIICLYFALEALKRRTWWVWFILITTIVFPPMFIGGRSNAAIIMSVTLMVYLFFHRISLKRFLILAVLGYATLIMFAAIADNRGKQSRTLDSFTEVDEDVSNPALSTLSEMGTSIQPLQYCIELMPNPVRYRHGESYLYALTTVVPNIGFWDVHPATKYANLGNWLQDYMALPFGPGFSIVAEAYYNFGEWGFLMMILLGYCMTYFFRHVSKQELIKDPIYFIIAVLFLWFTIKMARNSFEFAVRAVVYYCLPMYLLMKYYTKILIKKQ